LQALKSLGDKPLTPAADGVAIAPKFDSNFLVGWVVRLSRGQDDTAAENQGLGSGAGTDQGLQFDAKLFLQFNDGAEGARHGRPPGKFDQMVPLLVIMATHVLHG
jgi:hypothetical protein